MRDETLMAQDGVERANITIAGESFELWFEKGDTYLGSRGALRVRSDEASVFKAGSAIRV